MADFIVKALLFLVKFLLEIFAALLFFALLLDELDHLPSVIVQVNLTFLQRLPSIGLSRLQIDDLLRDSVLRERDPKHFLLLVNILVHRFLACRGTLGSPAPCKLHPVFRDLHSCRNHAPMLCTVYGVRNLFLALRRNIRVSKAGKGRPCCGCCLFKNPSRRWRHAKRLFGLHLVLPGDEDLFVV